MTVTTATAQLQTARLGYQARLAEAALPTQAENVPSQTDEFQASSPNTEAEPAKLVTVSHEREMRGAWVSTVYNINFPSSNTLPAANQKAEMIKMLDRLKECGFNAVFFQVRPEGDALYRSNLEPWSSSLTGTQGKDPGYDPLEFLCKEAHQRNLEVHAWLNPYRATAACKNPVAPHLAVTNPEHVHQYGSVKWMDPGAKVVKDRLVAVCSDITKRYDIDGVHFDDYFYPYPNGTDFPDQATFKAYQDGGGKLSKADWRRENVNQAVHEVHDAIKREKPEVSFGISPFGLPAPERPPGITGFNQYNEMYADTQKWMDNGWVDYLAPQLYWTTTQKGQEYGTLIDWWSKKASGGRLAFGGNNLDAIGSKPAWNVEEYKKEVELTRANYGKGAGGNIWWNVGAIMQDKQQIVSTFKNELYQKPALTPGLHGNEEVTVTAPQVTVNKDGLFQLKHNDSAPLRAYTIYRQENDKWELDRVIPGDQSTLDLGPGTWAIAAATMSGAESLGVVVEA